MILVPVCPNLNKHKYTGKRNAGPKYKALRMDINKKLQQIIKLTMKIVDIGALLVDSHQLLLHLVVDSEDICFKELN